MSAVTESKAQRLLAEGRVEGARTYLVRGDNGTYTVCASENLRTCTCDHFRHEGAGTCSHILAVDLLRETVCGCGLPMINPEWCSGGHFRERKGTAV